MNKTQAIVLIAIAADKQTDAGEHATALLLNQAAWLLEENYTHSVKLLIDDEPTLRKAMPQDVIDWLYN